MKFRGIVICVEYDDLLQITLPSNIHYFSECCVITSLNDSRTIELCESIPNVKVFRTDAFTRYGAKFNKGLAMEEGLEFFGKSDWMVIWDADCIFPMELTLPELEVGKLYGPNRLIFDDVKKWYRNSPNHNWRIAKPTVDIEFPGFFQLFHADDPVLASTPYWYDPTFIHAGGGDCYFQQLWAPQNKVRLNFNVLHLGPRDVNWFGRTSERVDQGAVGNRVGRLSEMHRLQIFNGWRKGSIGQHFNDRIVEIESDYVWNKSNPKKVPE